MSRALLKAAIAALDINVPVYRTEAGENGTLLLYCYGGEIHTYDPGMVTDPGDVVEDPVTTDFTVIPGVGPATAKKLHAAGIETWDDLRAADVDAIAPRAAASIEAYLAKEL
jgi:hypothetical protein